MITSLIKIIRLPNLIMMAFTMYLVRHCLLQPLLNLQQVNLQLSNTDFALLVSTVLLIAAAGYIINDYFDTKIDAINKPERVVVGREISRRQAMALHIVFNGVALLLSLYLASKSGNIKWALVQILSIGLLWFYSADYKRRLLVGNIVIAALTAVLPWLVWLYEPNRLYLDIDFIKWYSIFAFIISFIREIIKDMEDLEGDAQNNCSTLPIIAGIQVSKVVVSLLSVAMMLFIAYIQYQQYITQDKLSFYYFTLAIQLPFLALLYLLFTGKTSAQYAKASLLCKVIMLTGISSMAVFYYSLKDLLDKIPQ